MAQTEAAIDAVIVPISSDVPLSTVPRTNSLPDRSQARREQLRQKLYSAPTLTKRQVRTEISNPSTLARARRLRQKIYPATTPVKRERSSSDIITLSADRVSAPKVPAPITSFFGWRMHPILGDRRFHTGTDLGAPLGTLALAAYAGQVEIANFLGGYSLTVVLAHNKFTQQTLYSHLLEIFVQPGEWVEQGTVIERVGSIGNSTGPHFHFETRQLTPTGWVATDNSARLKYALAQLVEALRAAGSTQQPGG